MARGPGAVVLPKGKWIQIGSEETVGHTASLLLNERWGLWLLSNQSQLPLDTGISSITSLRKANRPLQHLQGWGRLDFQNNYLKNSLPSLESCCLTIFTQLSLWGRQNKLDSFSVWFPCKYLKIFTTLSKSTKSPPDWSQGGDTPTLPAAVLPVPLSTVRDHTDKYRVTRKGHALWKRSKYTTGNWYISAHLL